MPKVRGMREKSAKERMMDNERRERELVLKAKREVAIECWRKEMLNEVRFCSRRRASYPESGLDCLCARAP